LRNVNIAAELPESISENSRLALYQAAGGGGAPARLVLQYNRNDSDAIKRDKLVTNPQREVAMKNASHYRALASLCRQQAAYRPDQNWQLLGQAEHWEHLAEAEVAEHFKECNASNSGDLPDSAAA
jgi:hypothetical protein